MKLGFDKALGILSSIGRKLDRDVHNIYERLSDVCDRLERIEEKIDSLDKANSPATYSVDYTPEGAWTSTVLFKEEEEPEED